MPDQLTVPEERRAARRFGVRAVLAFVAVALVASRSRSSCYSSRPSLIRSCMWITTLADSLHTFAIGHPAFTAAMKVISTIGIPDRLVDRAHSAGSSGCSTGGCRGWPRSSRSPPSAVRCSTR